MIPSGNASQHALTMSGRHAIASTVPQCHMALAMRRLCHCSHTVVIGAISLIMSRCAS